VACESTEFPRSPELRIRSSSRSDVPRIDITAAVQTPPPQHSSKTESHTMTISDFSPIISADDVDDFRRAILLGTITPEMTRSDPRTTDAIHRYSVNMASYARYLSADGFEVFLDGASGSRCEVTIKFPDGKPASDLFLSTIQHGYYMGQVDYRTVMDAAIDAARTAWAGGPDGIRQSRAGFIRDIVFAKDRLDAETDARDRALIGDTTGPVAGEADAEWDVERVKWIKIHAKRADEILARIGTGPMTDDE
jgi:hypothetical protein